MVTKACASSRTNEYYVSGMINIVSGTFYLVYLQYMSTICIPFIVKEINDLF